MTPKAWDAQKQHMVRDLSAYVGGTLYGSAMRAQQSGCTRAQVKRVRWLWKEWQDKGPRRPRLES